MGLLISSEFARVLDKVFRNKKYGLVRNGGSVHIRDYGHELKNGRGRNMIQVHYDLLDQVHFREFFKPI